jgi:CheY-like chemotaxis protein
MLLKDKRIFVVEDNPMNRTIFQIALVKQGAQVDFERRGPDALFQLKRISHVDLIIMDLMLQNGATGFGLYLEIRKQPEFAAIPVVAISAMDPGIAIPEAKKLGMNGFIPKPIHSVNFPRQLARILEGEEVWEASFQSVS